jgi:L-malate glycosyltransferase
MEKKKPAILHITSWFNHDENSHEAVFVKNHIESLVPHASNHVLHICNEKKPLKILRTKRSTGFENSAFTFERVTVYTMTERWRELEFVIKRFLKKYLAATIEKFDVINFYIAYPNGLVIKDFISRYPDKSFTITEQWSAYHNAFGLPATSPGRKRIERIFDNNITLAVVSTSLGEDIRIFTGKKLAYFVIPAILEENFQEVERNLPTDKLRVCSINNWSAMKNPMTVIDAVEMLLKQGEQIELVLGGEGYRFDEIKQYIAAKGLGKHVITTGDLSRDRVAEILASSHIYLQSSVYETFSVICVEAISSGTPVIAHNVGGMRDFINDTNGMLVNDLEPATWANAILEMKSRIAGYDLKKMAGHMQDIYSKEKIGQLYFNALTKNLRSEK